MKTRGERQYQNFPHFAARLYDNLTNIKGVNQEFEEIALFVKSAVREGALLDVGTGPGRLLLEIHKAEPHLRLYGLDISSSMLEIARKTLRNVKDPDLRLGSITKTEFESDFFDAVVCTGTLYNWDRPAEALDEIHRILKPGACAYIFETDREYDKAALAGRIDQNLKGYSLIRRVLSKYFLKKQLKMTYSVCELDRIIKETKFRSDYAIRSVELGNLPIWLRIELKKSV